MSTALITVISSANSARLRQFFVDLWLYRDLFVAFIERDIKLRYKQTALGVVWVLLQPLLTAGIFTIVFGKVLGVSTGGLPAVVFYVSGMVPWSTFAQAVTGAASSLEVNAGLISKVYFPRVVVPGALVLATIPDFLIGFTLLNGLSAYYGVWSWKLLAIAPPLLVLQMSLAGGLGLLLAALNAQYRDVRYAIPLIVQMGMFASPVIYPLEKAPGWAQAMQAVNPMAGVIGSYRWALGEPAPTTELLVCNAAVALFFLIVGLVFFRWRESRLVDVL
ncbi:MAG: ABC transporter permease [Verrucomicrobia bacterium]|nr:ABC transporter permease [Verrucomicrobiota bacterium]